MNRYSRLASKSMESRESNNNNTQGPTLQISPVSGVRKHTQTHRQLTTKTICGDRTRDRLSINQCYSL